MSTRFSASLDKKSALNHYKKISEYSNHEKPSDDDVIIKLRNYRRQKSKPVSSIKESNLNQTEKSLQFHLRPQSSSNTNSIFLALKSQELSPLKINSAQLFLEQSVDRLYRGSRVTAKSIEFKNNPLFELAEVVSEKKQEEAEKLIIENDEKLNKTVLNNLNYLSSLKFDLELNWEISRNKETLSQENKLGVFYSLQEKLISASTLGSLNVFTLEKIVNELKECSRLFRDILRAITAKCGEDEAIMIDMLWKVMIKIMDESISMHQHSLNSVIECTKSKLKFISEDYWKNLRKLKDESESKISELNKQILSLSKEITAINKEKSDISRALYDKTKTLAELTEIESQEKACVDLRALLKKLSSYIDESESEQTKQVTTLYHLSNMIKAADVLRKPPECAFASTQTKWEIYESYLSELPSPITSSYSLSHILLTHIKAPHKLNALSLCQHALNNCDGQLNFYKELMICLLDQYKDAENIFSSIRGIYLHLLADKSNASKFYLLLLTNCRVCTLKIEQIIVKLSLLFEKTSEANFMTLGRFIEFLQSYLPEERNYCEEVLEMITKNYSEKDWFFVILYRFQLAVEKIGKGFKNLHESDTISHNEFLDLAKVKLGMWASDNDLNFFLSSSAKNLQISNLIHENSVSDKIKESKVEKEDFLFAAAAVLYGKYEKSQRQFDVFGKIQDFHQFKEILAKSQIDLPDKKVAHGFVEVILGIEWSELFENLLQREQINLKISDVAKSKKKPTKQGKKGKTNK